MWQTNISFIEMILLNMEIIFSTTEILYILEKKTLPYKVHSYLLELYIKRFRDLKERILFEKRLVLNLITVNHFIAMFAIQKSVAQASVAMSISLLAFSSLAHLPITRFPSLICNSDELKSLKRSACNPAIIQLCMVDKFHQR